MTQIRQLLAMDKASRMARAAEMGLTTPGFHGTTHPFDEFRPSQANSGFWDGRPDQYAGTHFAKDRAVSENIVKMNRLKRIHGSNQQGSDPRVISAMLPDLAGMKAVPQLPARSGWGDEMVHPQEDTNAIRDFLLHEYYKSDPENLERAIAEASAQMTKQEQRAVLEHLIGPDWQSYHAATKQRHTNTFGKPYRETPREMQLESLGPDEYQEEAVQLDNLKKQRDEFALAQPGGRASDAWVDRPQENVVLGRAVADRGVAALQKQGIRGLIYQNTNSPELGGFGNKPRIGTDPESYIVFDPANIRDERAAFDPSKRLSRNLMSSVAAATAAGIGAAAAGGAAAQAQGNSYPVVSPEEAGVDQYFQENPQVSGMAWGGGMNGSDPESQRSIVLNPHSKLSPEQYKSVERNEGIRHQMNESGWASDFEITPEQQAWAAQLGDYSANPAALRETIIARLASGDSVPTPTDEQQQIANTFSDPTAFGEPLPEGLIERGNINLYRPTIPNPDGGGSTVNSISVGFDGEHVLLPTADDGGIQTPEYAIEKYQRTGQHLGKFSTPEAADAYAGQLHDEYERGDYNAASPPEQESPQQPSEPVVGAPLIRYLQQEAGQNTVHQQSEPEFNQTGMAGDYLNHEPPTGAISGVSLREYLAPEDKERDYSPRGMYARSVLNAMSQPVIQNPSSGEYLSMSEYVKQRVRADAMQKLGDTPMTDEVSQRVQAAIEERASAAADNVGGVLAGTLRTNNQYTKDLAAQVRSEVQRHAPGGDKALLGHRTQSEENTSQQEYGSESKHMLTADGQRNHQALAISELLNAQDTNYAPDTGLSHTARLIGSVVAPAYSMFTSPGGGGAHGFHLPRTTGDALDEDALFRKPDGRLEYAANLYARSRDPSTASVYTPEGRPKYGPYNMQGIDGVVAGTQENQTYPMAFGYQNTTVPVSEVASNIAAPGYRNNVAALRAATKRTTPVIPDGVDPKKVQQLSQQLSGATDKLHDWPSAYYGPKKADLVNSVLGGKEMPRSYFSPAEQVLFDLPAELFDPANLVGSAIAPPLAAVRGGMGAASLGMRSMLKAGAVAGARSVPRAAVTVGDDLFQEGATSAGLLATAGDLGNAFIPKKTNSLMDDINPNTPGFDQKLERNAIDQRMRQQDAAEQYAKMTGTYVPPKPKKPMSLPPTNWLQP